MMNAPLLRAGTLVLTVLCALPGAPALSAEPNIEQQIKAGLVPPVLVEGERPPLTSLSTRMQALHVPAVSIAVIRKGKLVWAGGFGPTKPGGPPVTADTLFQAGSISKPLTAAAVMVLVQDRKLDLDTDINQYLKSWKLPESPLTEHSPVTLRELLSHSAGVNVSGFGGYEVGQPVPTLVQVLNGERPAYNPPIRVDVAPGTVWRYSGGGYVIAQQVLIDVAGTSFPKLMRERVLAPFGMNQSSFQQPLASDLLPRAATPYAANDAPVKGGPHTYAELAPAGLWTTPSDLARFAIGIQRALAGLSEGVLSQASARAMLSPVGGEVSVPFKGDHQAGHGVILGGKTDRKYFEHHGGNQGYSGYVMAYDRGDGAAIMVNTSNNDCLLLIDDIMRTIAHAYGWPDFEPARRTLAKIAPASFDRYIGAYRAPSGDLIAFWRDDKHLESRVWGQPAGEIFPSSTQEYFSRTSDRTWMFSEDKGTITGVKLNENGSEQQLTRLDDREGRPAVERSMEIEKRIQSQTPAPGSEQILLGFIADVMNGKPNYDQLSPGFAQLVRRELAGVQKLFGEYGSVQSASFKRVLPEGRDVYEVAMQHGPQEFEILMAPDGRIQMVLFNR